MDTPSADDIHRTMVARALDRMARPLDEEYPAAAEFLGGRGYATAGFIANTS